MTNKEYILDCLADGDEAETQIKEFFKFVGVDISIDQTRKLISEMLHDGLICVNEKWVNEVGENPYAMTDKGKELWNKK